MVLSHELTGQTIRLARPDISQGTGAPVRPQAIRVWVERPAVMRLLDDSTTHALKVVTAPAGTGKTLTVARWSAAQTGSPVTWVSSASGMDPQHLANLLRATAGLPAYPRGSSRKVMIERTAESLARRSAEQIVVIDDAHLMSTQCFTVIDELLSHANKYTAALYLGRSTQTGVGCDDTRGPHTELHPVVKTIPSDAAAARQAFPWITFEGRWRELQPAFFNSASGRRWWWSSGCSYSPIRAYRLAFAKLRPLVGGLAIAVAICGSLTLTGFLIPVAV